MEQDYEGILLIETSEGLFLTPYLDSAGIASIGFGTIRYPNGNKVKITDPAITREQAHEFMMWEIQKLQFPLRRLAPGLPTKCYSALLSFTYNIGLGAFSSSTMLKLIKQKEWMKASEQFLRWKFAGGVESKGLLNRRKREKRLFDAGIYEFLQTFEVEESAA